MPAHTQRLGDVLARRQAEVVSALDVAGCQRIEQWSSTADAWGQGQQRVHERGIELIGVLKPRRIGWDVLSAYLRRIISLRPRRQFVGNEKGPIDFVVFGKVSKSHQAFRGIVRTVEDQTLKLFVEAVCIPDPRMPEAVCGSRELQGKSVAKLALLVELVCLVASGRAILDEVFVHRLLHDSLQKIRDDDLLVGKANLALGRAE